MKWKLWHLIAAPALGALLAGCAADDETLLEPDVEPASELFERYVALGNSITMGIQSAGINDSTQRLAYPVLIAQQANASFVVPSLAMPGCPAPLTGPLLLNPPRVGGAAASDCALRSTPLPSLVQNLAVTGANITDALDALGNPDANDQFNRLQFFILGGRSMLDALVQSDPSLVSVALGSGDALGAALDGDVSALTPLADFRSSAERIADVIADDTDAQEAVFIGTLNPGFVPFLQPGAYFYALRQAGQLPKQVNPNCAPGTPGSRNFISLNALISPTTTEIDCADGAPFVSTGADIAAITARVAAYNEILAEVAASHGFLFVDINPVFLSYLSDPDAVRKCQGLATAATVAEFTAAVVSTCPGPSAPNFFGALFSFDGVHPSSIGQRLLANAVIRSLNEAHQLAVPLLDIPSF